MQRTSNLCTEDINVLQQMLQYSARIEATKGILGKISGTPQIWVHNHGLFLSSNPVDIVKKRTIKRLEKAGLIKRETFEGSVWLGDYNCYYRWTVVTSKLKDYTQTKEFAIQLALGSITYAPYD